MGQIQARLELDDYHLGKLTNRQRSGESLDAASSRLLTDMMDDGPGVDAADLCPHTGRGRLSYERAEYLFKQDTKQHDPRKRGFTLHQLRHSRLTHLAEDGWSAPMLMALSGHENIRSLAIYTNVSTEAVGAALAQQDPARRHR